MRVVVGTVTRPHGLRGEVVVELSTDEPDRRFAAGAAVDTEPGGERLTVSATRRHGRRLLVQFAGATRREAVEGLRGQQLTAHVPDDELPADPEEWYDQHLVGLRAETPDGAAAGRVVAVEHLPAQDLLVVERLDGTQAMVPFVRELVPTVDEPGGVVRIVAHLLADPDGDP